MRARYGRRRFIRATGVASAGLGAWLAACGGSSKGSGTTKEAPTAAATRGAVLATVEPVEKAKLTIGFIPITCATPIIMAAPLGFYRKHGLDVTVKKYAGWADIRDAFIAGEIDASHLLSPMPLAMSLGVGSAKVAARLAAIENINGQAITLAVKHKDKVKGPQDFRGKTIAVPFDFSMHNFLLRHYLAQGGVNPDTEVQIRVMRPPDMVANLVSGNIDGYLGPDPFNQRAVFEKAGFIFMLSKDMWNGHPCCAFAVKEEFRQQHPATYRALVRSIVDATVWSKDAANREQIAEAIAPTEYLNQPPAVVKAVLTGNFEDGQGQTLSVPNRIDFDPFPWRSFGVWMGTQMQRWGYAKNNEFTAATDYKKAADEVFMAPDVRAAMKALNYDAPAADYKTETIFGKSFNAEDPLPWTQKTVA